MTSLRTSRILGLTGSSAGALIPLGFALLLLALLPGAAVFIEWDGALQLYSGRELIAGAGYHGWPSHFWPPLFAALEALGEHLVSGHTAGRIVSLLAAVALLVVVYLAVVRLSGSRRAGILAQLLLVTNPLFVRESLQAQNRMLESALLLACLLLLLEADRARTTRWYVAAGVLAALAGLTRYTSYVLFPLGVIIALTAPAGTPIRRRVHLAGAFTLAVVAVSLPWWLYNTLANGSPLGTWHYLNVAMTVVSRADPAVSAPAFLWSIQGNFSGVGDVVRQYPVAFFSNYLHNLIQCVRLPATLAGAWSLLLVPAFLDALLSLRGRSARDAAIVLLAFVMWAGLVSQALVPDYACVVWVVVILITVALFVIGYLRRLGSAIGRRASLVAEVVIAALVVSSAVSAHTAMAGYRAAARNGGALLPDALAVSRSLRASDTALSRKYVMALHPGWAYELGSRFLALPTYYVGSARSLVTYGGLSTAVRRYAPKVPTTTPLDHLRADYLLFDSSAARALPRLAFLLDPQSSKVPRWFRPRFVSARIVVYDLDWSAADSTPLHAPSSPQRGHGDSNQE